MTGLASFLVGLSIVASDLPKASSPAVVAFEYKDVEGKNHSIKDWTSAKAVVLLFISVDCPGSNGYAPELARLAKSYGDRGVLFYGVLSDPDVTVTQAADHAKEYHLPFPILLDPTQRLARQVGARRVPTAAVLASEGKLLYCGRVDNRYISLGKKRPEPTERDMQTALDCVLAGKVPGIATTEVIGCLLPKPQDAPVQKPRE